MLLLLASYCVCFIFVVCLKRSIPFQYTTVTLWLSITVGCSSVIWDFSPGTSGEIQYNLRAFFFFFFFLKVRGEFVGLFAVCVHCVCMCVMWWVILFLLGLVLEYTLITDVKVLPSYPSCCCRFFLRGVR